MASTTYNYPGQRFVHPALRWTSELHVGGVSFGYEDVAAYEVSSLRERDWDGQILCTAVYALGSSLFLIGILIGILDWKFLIAVVFLGAVAAMSVIDALGTVPVTVHVLDMTLDDGRQVQFVDGDARVVDTLAERIDAAGGG